MLHFPDIKPYIIKIGPIQIRWYGLMYLFGFLSSYLLIKYQIKKKSLYFKKKDIDDLFLYVILGLILGARIGYVIFYNISFYLKSPLEIIAIWHGGMSFHGGLIGVLIAGILFCIKRNIDFWLLSDLVIVTAPIGLGLGRLGNFFNGELYGRTTTLQWGMIFPDAGSSPRHPSQLYEMFLEGVVLFVILWLIKDRVKISGALLCIFLILYGAFRFIAEFFREPDIQIGFIMGVFTMGQVLSIIMIIAGITVYAIRKRTEERRQTTEDGRY